MRNEDYFVVFTAVLMIAAVISMMGNIASVGNRASCAPLSCSPEVVSGIPTIVVGGHLIIIVLLGLTLIVGIWLKFKIRKENVSDLRNFSIFASTPRKPVFSEI